jgi:Fic family protein
MTYVLQLHQESNFHFEAQLLRSLHFMMMSYDLRNRPGLWRAGAIYVRNDATGDVVYEGPDVEEVPTLMQDLTLRLEQDTDTPPMVLGAMAHLNLVMIHPFRDGNGRMGRCVQTLVLARNGIVSPVFCSIEEYLGANTQAYYDVLAEVGAGKWQPQRDARTWVRFILTAHLRQARTSLRRVKEAERLWDELERLIADRGVNPRTIFALYDACVGFRVRNATYRAIALAEDETAGLTEQAASRDLKTLHQGGLLVPHGEKRGRFYTASPELWDLRKRIVEARDPRNDSDPFAA